MDPPLWEDILESSAYAAIVILVAFDSCQSRRHVADTMVGNLGVGLASLVKESEAHCRLVAVQIVCENSGPL